MASPVTYKNWSEVPDGAVLRGTGVFRDVAARSGNDWSWHRLSGTWGVRATWALARYASLCFAEPAREIARLPPGPTHEQIRAAVEAIEAAERAPAPPAEPLPGARYATLADLPAGIFRDAEGDLLVCLAPGRFAWLRTTWGWRDHLGTSVSDAVWPVRWLAPLPADTAPTALRAAAEAGEAALPLPALGAKIAQWADVPEGAVLLDSTGDVALRRRGGRCWLRVGGGWEADADARRDSYPRAGKYEPYTYIGQAADVTEARTLVEARERAAAPAKPVGPQVGDEVPPTEEAWLALPRGTLVHLTAKSLAHPFAYVRQPQVGSFDYVDETGTRIGNAAPWSLGERGRGRIVALGALLDDEIAAARKATLEAGRTPSAPTPRQWKAGDPVRPEDMAALPVGAVVDTRDGPGDVTLLVRGERGWAWASKPLRNVRGDSPSWRGAIRCVAALSSLYAGAFLAGIVAPGTVGRAFDEALAAQGYGPAVAALAPQAEPQPSAPPTPGRTWQIGQPVQDGDWELLPVGAVVDSGDGSETPFLVRGPTGWGRASTYAHHGVVWAEPGAYGAMHPSGPRPHPPDARLVALGLDLSGTDFERDKVMRAERLRVLLELNGTRVDARGRVVKSATVLAPPAPPALDAATECARIRAARVAGLEGALAAAAARLREVEAAWTVTKSGGIRWHHDGQSGQICAATDMPGADRRAKRIHARALVAEHEAKRAVVLGEHNRLADLVARTRPQPRGHVCVNGVQVEVTASTAAEDIAAAFRAAGYPTEVRGGVLYFDPEQWR